PPMASPPGGGADGRTPPYFWVVLSLSKPEPGLLALLVLAAVSLLTTTLLAHPADASLGKVRTSRIYADSLRGDTPTTWNAHLPKMASAHGWVYFVYTRDSSTGPAY